MSQPDLPDRGHPGRRRRSGRAGCRAGGPRRGRRRRWLLDRLDRPGRRWGGHRRVRGRGPARGRRDLRRGRRGAARRGRRPEVGRPDLGDPARAGAVRPPGRPGPVRQPPTGDRPPEADPRLAAPAGAAPRGRHAHRPRAHGRSLFRVADRGGWTARRAVGERHAAIRRARDRPRRPAGLRAGAAPAAGRSRVSTRPTFSPPHGSGARSRRRSRRSSRTSPSITGSWTPAPCRSSGRRPRSTSS